MRISTVMSWLVAGASGAFMLFATWLVLHITPVFVDPPGAPIKNPDKYVEQGGIITLTRRYCVVNEPIGDGWAERKLISSSGETIMITSNVVAKDRAKLGCFETLHDVLIPRTVIPGSYTLTVSITYPVNMMMKSKYVLPSHTIHVVPHPAGPLTNDTPPVPPTIP